MSLKTIQKLMHETEQRMGKTVEAMEADFKGIRTGRASPALIERVMVPYYGTPHALKSTRRYIGAGAAPAGGSPL